MLLEYKDRYDEPKELYGDKWIDPNKLFIQSNGKTMPPDPPGKWYKSYIESLGLPVVKLHGIRYTNATLLIFQNVDIATVSARLRHASINTTIKYYNASITKKYEKSSICFTRPINK